MSPVQSRVPASVGYPAADLCFGLNLIMFFHLDPIVLGVSDTFQHILTTNHLFADIPRLFLRQFVGQHNVKFTNKTFILTSFQSLTH